MTDERSSVYPADRSAASDGDLPVVRSHAVSSHARLSAQDVARRSFGTVRRGLDPEEVRSFLEVLSRQLEAAEQREQELIEQLAGAEERARHPKIDEATLTAALGQRSASILRAAHEEAARIAQQAETSAATLLREAQQHATDAQVNAESQAAERVAEAELEANAVRQQAREDASVAAAAAKAEGEALVERAREHGRAMLDQAQDARRRVLADVAQRRRTVADQIEQFRAARDEVAGSVVGVRRSLERILEDLARADDEARSAANAARPHHGDTSEAVLVEEAERAAAEIGADSGSAIAHLAGSGDALLHIASSPRPTLEAAPSEVPRSEASNRDELGGAPNADATAGRSQPSRPGVQEVGIDERAGPPRTAGDPVVSDGTSASGESVVLGEHAWEDVAGGAEEVSAEESAAGEVGRIGAERSAEDSPGEDASRSPGADEGAGPERSIGVSRQDVAGGAPPATASTQGDPGAPPDAAGTGSATDVDDLFARLRARGGTDAHAQPGPRVEGDPNPDAGPGERAGAGANANGVPPAPETGAPRVGDGEVDAEPREAAGAEEAETVGPTPDAAASDAVAPDAAASDAAAPDVDTDADEASGPGEGRAEELSPDELALAARAATVEPIAATLARKLKRALQDDQNRILDVLRQGSGEWRDAVSSDDAAQRALYSDAAAASVRNCVGAGITFARSHAKSRQRRAPVPDEHEVSRIAGELAGSVVTLLRRRLDGDDVADPAERIGAAYREWRGERIERLAHDVVTEAYDAGVLAGSSNSAGVRWVRSGDGPGCADCEDNALTGAVPPGEEFPTGHRHPPAHPGCRCLLLPTSP